MEPSLFLLVVVRPVHLDSQPLLLEHLALGLDSHPVAVAAAAAVLVAFAVAAVVSVAVVAVAAAVIVAAALRAGVGQQHPEVQSSLLHREVLFSSSLP